MRFSGIAYILWTLAFRNVLRSKRRSLLTLSAIVVAVWSSLTLGAIARGIVKQVRDDAVKHLTGHIQINSPSYRADPVVQNSMDPPGPVLSAALADPRIKAWSSRVRVPATISSERESSGIVLTGILPERERRLSFLSSAPVDGRFLDSPDDPGIIIGASKLERLSTRLGKRVVILSEDVNGKVVDRGFRIAGVFHAVLSSVEDQFAFVGQKTAQDFLGLSSKISEVSLLVSDDNIRAAVLEKLKAASPGLEVSSWEEREALFVAISRVQEGFLYLWFVVSVIAASFGLINSLFMATFERIREFGLVQALGMRRNLLVVQVVFESLFLLLAGCAIGTILGFSSAWLLSGGINLANFARGTAMYQLSSIVYPFVIPTDVLAVNGLMIGIGTTGALYPAWLASRREAREVVSL